MLLVLVGDFKVCGFLLELRCGRLHLVESLQVLHRVVDLRLVAWLLLLVERLRFLHLHTQIRSHLDFLWFSFYIMPRVR